MNHTKPSLSQSVLAICLGAIAMGTTLPTLADETSGSAPADHRQACQQDRMRLVLARMADRLEIKPSQMKAWKDFSATFAALPDSEMHRPPRDGDAAQLLQYRAERARGMSEKLTMLAQAASALQAVLSPEQKEVLNEIVRSRMLERGHFGQRDGHGRAEHPDWRRG
jgi:hypothetical protein